jgi:hypothetical protein
MLWASGGTNIVVVTNSVATNATTYVSIQLAWPPLQQIATNDIIWQCTTNGILPAGTALTTYGADSGGIIYCGQPGTPLLMMEDILAQGKILIASGTWQ